MEATSSVLPAVIPPVGDDFLDCFGTAPGTTTVISPAAVPGKEVIATYDMTTGTITYHEDVMQGTEEWLALRRGVLTASEMKLIVTPGLKIADNDKGRAHVFEIAAQRVTENVEPHYVGDDMLRGHDDECDAVCKYITEIAPVQIAGFITNDSLGFTIGYSPDGLVGDEGLIECKSRRQKYQFQTAIECVKSNTIPAEYMIQIQTGLLVTGRKWCDFLSYCGGMHMIVIRVYPDFRIQAAIVAAARAFETKVQNMVDDYYALIESPDTLMFPTERRVELEIH